MLSIALGELIQIFRNRLVLVTSFIMPTAVSAYFIRQHEVFADLGSLGYIAAVVVFTVGAFGLYTTTVTTLASRRQNLFLKRLRSTPAGDAGDPLRADAPGHRPGADPGGGDPGGAGLGQPANRPTFPSWRRRSSPRSS